MHAHEGAADVRRENVLPVPGESMQATKRRRVAAELDLAERAGERASEASRRAGTAVGSGREAHRRAAEAQERAARAHREVADVQRKNLAIEEGLHGRRG